MTRDQLAAAAGTSRSALSAYERGARSPTVATLDRLLASCDLQLRVDLEPLLADVDAAVERMLSEPAELPDGWERVAAALSAAGVTWSFDGRTAMAMHGLSAGAGFCEVACVGDDALRRFLYRLGVGAVDRDDRILWDSWLDLDLRKAVPTTAFTRVGVFTARIVAALEAPLQLHIGTQTVPVLTLLELEVAHRPLADVLARLRQRRTVDR